MSDLSALALKYSNGTPGKPQCAKCRGADVEARIVVQVKNARKNQKIVAGRVRSVCGRCAAEIFDALMEQLPEDIAR